MSEFDKIVAAGLNDVAEAGRQIIEDVTGLQPFGAELLTDTSRDVRLGDLACAAGVESRADDQIIHTGGGEGNDDSYDVFRPSGAEEAAQLA